MRKITNFLIKTLIILILLVAVFFAYSHLVEPSMLNKTEFSLSCSKLSADEIKIAFFSDTHFSDNYTAMDFQAAIDMINQEKPDLILFGGDFFDDFDSYTGDVDALIASLCQLEASIGKYAVFGNHDYGGKIEFKYEALLESGGFTVLKNEIVNFDDINLSLIAIDDCLIGYGDVDIAKAANPDKFNLILCHEPDIIDTLVALDCSFDLMLSGHTHGGQLNIPLISRQFLPPLGKNYVSGVYNVKEDNYLFVTKGLGTSILSMRFMAVPEVCFITLSKE